MQPLPVLPTHLTGILALLFLGHTPSHTADVRAAKPYEAAVQKLDAFIQREVADKRLPALSIALVDDQSVVWAKGYGFADLARKKPATAATVYRVGSVSKLFTDLALMRLVERGVLDLDAPITRYLPDFHPANPFGKPITLRQMMAHRSGLVREPPSGNYFDSTPPSLAGMARSLNETELVYAPETKTKYSNAAIASAGLVLEVTQKQPFARYLQRVLLDPLGMKESSFTPTPNVTRNLAQAIMWSYQGREFPAPTFELGMAPAGSMYSTVLDLGRFLSMLLAAGKGPQGVIVRPETLEKMWTPQFVSSGGKEGFGLGFLIGEFAGRRRISHGGAIYGFATELSALPGDKLGVVVITSCDCANGVTSHIAEVALSQMLAVHQSKPLPEIASTARLRPEQARELAGHYQSGAKTFDLREREGRLWMLPGRGGVRLELRRQGKDLVVDDRLLHGPRLERDGDKLRFGKDVYERVSVAKPGPLPAKWAGLIGEYGWDHNTLYVLEKDGKLQVVIEWFCLYPLKEVSEDVYEFPDFGLYHGEKLVFTRDRKGRAVSVKAAGVVFPRRTLDGENGRTFTIKPQRPLAELRRAAQAAQPPREQGKFHKPDFVDVATLDPTIKLDIRYATANNFLSTPLYPMARAFLQRPAAEALTRVQRQLARQGYGLLIYDAYRPWSITKMFWDATPPSQRVFVADPAQGSRHNRGCAVDVTLVDRQTGKPVEMVGGYDEFSDRSYADYLGGTDLQRYHRELLRHAMEAEGFRVYDAEWWHFDYKDWPHYPISNLSLEKVEQQMRRHKDSSKQ